MGLNKLVYLSLVFLSLLTSCEDKRDQTPPVLKNLLVEMSPYNSDLGKAGDIVFDSSEDKVFLEFGAKLTNARGMKLRPSFEYHLDKDAKVLSPVEGVVTHLEFQAKTNDYEIGISPQKNSAYIVVVDHITNQFLQVGDTVLVGQTLGQPGPWSSHPELGRVELLILKDDEAYCPFLFFDEALQATYEDKIKTLMLDWERFKSDSSLYEEFAMPFPGCNYQFASAW